MTNNHNNNIYCLNINFNIEFTCVNYIFLFFTQKIKKTPNFIEF